MELDLRDMEIFHLLACTGIGRNFWSRYEFVNKDWFNREKYILNLGKGPTQGLEHTLSAKKMYSIDFTEHNKKFCLSLDYNGANSYFFVNGKENHKFRAKDIYTIHS